MDGKHAVSSGKELAHQQYAPDKCGRELKHIGERAVTQPDRPEGQAHGEQRKSQKGKAEAAFSAAENPV
jgi:hypothetical protein